MMAETASISELRWPGLLEHGPKLSLPGRQVNHGASHGHQPAASQRPRSSFTQAFQSMSLPVPERASTWVTTGSRLSAGG